MKPKILVIPRLPTDGHLASSQALLQSRAKWGPRQAHCPLGPEREPPIVDQVNGVEGVRQAPTLAPSGTAHRQDQPRGGAAVTAAWLSPGRTLRWELVGRESLTQARCLSLAATPTPWTACTAWPEKVRGAGPVFGGPRNQRGLGGAQQDLGEACRIWPGA